MSFKKPKFWDYNRITVCVVILFPLTLVYRFIYWIIKISKPLNKYLIIRVSLLCLKTSSIIMFSHIPSLNNSLAQYMLYLLLDVNNNNFI